MKTYSWRPFGDVFCSVVWGGTRRWPTIVKTERFGAPGPYIHTYKQPKQFTIQTFRQLKGRITLYVKPYLLDKTHAFWAKHTYIHTYISNMGTFGHTYISESSVFIDESEKNIKKTSKTNCYVAMYVWRNAVNMHQKWVKPPKYISM